MPFKKKSALPPAIPATEVLDGPVLAGHSAVAVADPLDPLDPTAPASVSTTRASAAARNAIRARWESVREERERWILPFSELKTERALQYLEDLRSIVQTGAEILNDRINGQKGIRCAGPKCGKDVSGLTPSGRPKWIAQKVLRDAKNPNLMRAIYFCSEICCNKWVRETDGAGGSESKV